MPGSHHRSLRDRLPHAKRLSEDAQRRWAHEWLRVIWTRPRYLVARVVTYAVLVGAYFYFDLAAILGWFWRVLAFGLIFGIGEEIVYALSRPKIGARILEELAKQRPNQATMQRTPKAFGVADLESR